MGNNSEMNILGLTDILLESSSSSSASIVNEKNSEEKEEQPKRPMNNVPAKKWEYFEIGDHPKAISDKKLLQLKNKYQRRNTEPALAVSSGAAKGDIEAGYFTLILSKRGRSP